MIKNVSSRRRAIRPTGVHRGQVVPPALSTQQTHDLEELDHLLAELIRQNRRLRLRMEKLAKAVTSLGEDEVDKLLKSMRKRVSRVKTRAGRPIPATRRRPAAV